MASSTHYARAIQPEYPRVMRAQDAADPIALHSGSLFLRNLPNADLRRLVPHLRLTDLPREEIICRHGDMIQSIIFPHDGIVSLTSLLTDGTMIESATVGGEGYVGVEVMLGSAVAACSVIAQPGRVSTIALDRLLILLDQVPSLRPAMLAYARAYLAVVTRLAACNALHTLKQRACRRLVLARDQTEPAVSDDHSGGVGSCPGRWPDQCQPGLPGIAHRRSHRLQPRPYPDHQPPGYDDRGL
jgi:CRP-like cAMP-binding protein